MPRRYTVSYYPWITQGVGQNEIRLAVETFSSRLEDVLREDWADASVVVNMESDISPQVSSLVEKDRQLALTNPLGYVCARAKNKAIHVVAVALRKGLDGVAGPTYRAQIYTSKKSAIRGLGQIRGRSVGFGVPFSTSNFLFPASLLKKNNLLFQASSISFLGGHDIIAKHVYDGMVDVGAGHDGVITNLARSPGYGDAEDRLVRLEWTEPIPSDPLAVNIADEEERETVARAILSVGQEKETISSAISVFWGGSTGLAETTASHYDSIDEKLRELALVPEDVID
jgi:phosphonate transport system substrate-binding protein